MAYALSKKDARAFRKRWRLVNARQEEELRTTSIEVKWQQFNTLLRWAHEFGWTEALGEGDAEVRERWVRIRKAFGGKKGEN
jgi:hypothetical protein